MKKTLSLMSLFALTLSAGPLHAQPVTGKAGLLTDAAGRVLYVFDKDSEGKSVCYDQCAALWPPFVAAADAKPVGDYGLVTRSDGSRQWAVRGRPLYFYAGDSGPGQATGDGVKGVWHVVRDTPMTGDAGSYRPKEY
ncbi:COG4315 family predicted lipoprotein [Methyloversatilis universalis]|uniref:COG4315 family predicted lipoprotein n=1 Tax=Methyloversatilis universalis TaxID=378211 RepID=UPI0003A019C6|nr:hypothetical protein [Methyloversatilis universalis]